MSGKYILDGHKPILIDDTLEWAKWYETADRHVGRYEENGVRVSTVFLGLDHNFMLGGPPILFETMIFGGPDDGYQERYCTWEEAEAGHAIAVQMTKLHTEMK